MMNNEKQAVLTIQSRTQHRLHDRHTNSGIWNWRSALGQVFANVSNFHLHRIFSRNDLRIDDRLQEKQGHDRRY